MRQVDEDVEWRVAEIASIKSLHLRNRLNQKDADIAIRANIPLMYAVWEGFVVNSLTKLAIHLNSLNADIKDLDNKLVTHLVDGHAKLHNARTNFGSKCNQVEIIKEILFSPAKFSVVVETESNINFKVLNKLLSKFNIECFDSSYRTLLNRLLKYRNSIAHGENAMPVNTGVINEFGTTVRELIYDLRDKLELYIENEKYRVVA